MGPCLSARRRGQIQGKAGGGARNGGGGVSIDSYDTYSSCKQIVVTCQIKVIVCQEGIHCQLQSFITS